MAWCNNNILVAETLERALLWWAKDRESHGACRQAETAERALLRGGK